MAVKKTERKPAVSKKEKPLASPEFLSAMDRYLQLRRAGNFTQARKVIKKAVTEFPGDFRLLVRLMDVVTAEENISDDGAASA